MSSAAPAPAHVVPARDITVRRPELAFEDVPQDFVTGDPLARHIAAMLSAVFPEGEDYFVRSVRNYRDRITDPQLRAQVSGFIGQEARHGREHRQFNARLQQLGYPTRFVDRRVKHGLWLLGRTAPRPVQLAVTAALEHYTATLAETLLTDEATLGEFGDATVRKLFAWHALEETEHKAVAFDVYQHVSGDQTLRIATMLAVHVGFVVGMSTAVALSVSFDREARRPSVLWRGLRHLPSHPLFSPTVRARLREYHRRDFHPDSHDTTELLERWRATLGDLRAA